MIICVLFRLDLVLFFLNVDPPHNTAHTCSAFLWPGSKNARYHLDLARFSKREKNKVTLQHIEGHSGLQPVKDFQFGGLCF